jgi:hypothetical protein
MVGLAFSTPPFGAVSSQMSCVDATALEASFVGSECGPLFICQLVQAFVVVVWMTGVGVFPFGPIFVLGRKRGVGVGPPSILESCSRCGAFVETQPHCLFCVYSSLLSFASHSLVGVFCGCEPVIEFDNLVHLVFVASDDQIFIAVGF